MAGLFYDGHMMDNENGADLIGPLEITDLTVDGRGVARHEGRVLFVDNALPGAILFARPRASAGKVPCADAARVLRASPHECAPWCVHAGICGACPLQAFSYEAALEWKRTHVRQCFMRIGKIADPHVLPLVPSPRVRAFRNKMSFAFGNDAHGRCLLGLRQRNGRDIVEVSACGAQHESAMGILAHTRDLVRRLGLPAWTGDGKGRRSGSSGYLRFLVIRIPEYRPDEQPQPSVECITGPDHALQVRGEDGQTREAGDAVRLLGKDLMRLFSLSSFVHGERRHSAALASSERACFILGTGEIQERFGPLHLVAPYNAFLQTNTGAAALLYETVADEAGDVAGKRIWDLYCGVGGIGLFLAAGAGEVHGFEAHPESVTAARKNSAALGFGHCFFYEGPLSKTIKTAPPPDIIVLDPPRAGLEKDVTEALLHLRASRLLYISCDPATQARDIARLAPAWSLIKCRPVDMFPFTPHVENLAVLERTAEI